MMEAWFRTREFHLEFTCKAVNIVRHKLRRVIQAGSR